MARKKPKRRADARQKSLQDTRRKAYEEIKALNASVLVKGLKSMLSLDNARHGKVDVKTPGMEFGSQYHCLILEPDDFRKKHRVLPDFAKDPRNVTSKGSRSDSASTTWAKTAKALFLQECEDDGVEVITQKNYDRAQKMIEALNDPRRDKRAYALLRGCKREVTLEGELLGVKLKGRVDLLDSNSLHTHADIKGCVDCASVPFGRRIANLNVKFRFALYRELIRQNGLAVDKHELIAVESDGDFDVATYTAPEDWMDSGFKQVMEVLHKFKACEKTGVWSGYSQGLKVAQPLFVPEWDMPEDGGNGLDWAHIEGEARPWPSSG